MALTPKEITVETNYPTKTTQQIINDVYLVAKSARDIGTAGNAKVALVQIINIIEGNT